MEDLLYVVMKITNVLETELMLGAVITSSIVRQTSSYIVWIKVEFLVLTVLGSIKITIIQL